VTDNPDKRGGDIGKIKLLYVVVGSVGGPRQPIGEGRTIGGGLDIKVNVRVEPL